MEGATLHTGACKQRLQYDGRPDGRFREWGSGTWKLRSQSAKGEVYKELRKRMIDVCCLQEVKWRI